MSVVTPLGGLNRPLVNAKELLARCASFREWASLSSMVEADAIAAAKERIHLHALPPSEGNGYTLNEQDDARPGIVLYRPAGALTISRIATGPTPSYVGRICARIEGHVPQEYEDNEADAEMEFTNWIGKIIDELWQVDEGLGFLVPREVSLIEDVRRAHMSSRRSEGDYFSVTLALDW